MSGGYDAEGPLPGWRAEIERETSIDVVAQAIHGGKIWVTATHRPTGIKARVEAHGAVSQLQIKAEALQLVQDKVDKVWQARRT